MEKVCEVCGKKFEAKRETRIFCSGACQQRKWRSVHQDEIKAKLTEERRERLFKKWKELGPIFCEVCGKQIEFSVRFKKRFCSEDCARIGNYSTQDHKDYRKNYSKVWVENNKDRINNQRRKRHSEYKRRIQRIKCYYNLTEEDYVSLMDKQKGCCAICGDSLCASLVVDHDHSTGKVRGLLCTTCNSGLGFFRDNTLVLSNAIKYLESQEVDN